MNETNLKAILKGVGLPDSILTDIDKPEFDAKATIAAYNESQKAHFKPLIENEIRPDIETEVRDATFAKWTQTLNNDIKKYGIPLESIKEMKTHEKLKMLSDTLEAKYKGSGTSEEMLRIQQENIEWKNKYGELEGSVNTEVEKKLEAERSKVQARLVDLDLQEKFKSIPSDRILGKKHTDGVLLALKSHLSAKYDLRKDENDNTVPYEKGTQKRVQGKNADQKEYLVPVEDLLLSSLKELGLSIESNGGEGSGQQGQGSGNGQKQKSQRVLEMEAKIAQG